MKDLILRLRTEGRCLGAASVRVLLTEIIRYFAFISVLTLFCRHSLRLSSSCVSLLRRSYFIHTHLFVMAPIGFASFFAFLAHYLTVQLILQIHTLFTFFCNYR